MLPKFAELNTTTRGNPCQEYPGTYYIYLDGFEIDSFTGKVGEARALDRLRQTAYHDKREGQFSLAWQASDNDPRIGQVWFTGYYTLDTRR